MIKVAGGVSSEDDGVMKTVIRECKEEAGISERMASSARPAGTLRLISELYFAAFELKLFLSTLVGYFWRFCEKSSHETIKICKGLST